MPFTPLCFLPGSLIVAESTAGNTILLFCEDDESILTGGRLCLGTESKPVSMAGNSFKCSVSFSVVMGATSVGIGTACRVLFFLMSLFNLLLSLTGDDFFGEGKVLIDGAVFFGV